MADLPKEKKVDPLEVFQVIGASEQTDYETLEKTAREMGASPEVVQFLERLPHGIHEPSEVVAAVPEPEEKSDGAELVIPEENEEKPALTIEEVTGKKRAAPSEGREPQR